jgi:hypothetical protein
MRITAAARAAGQRMIIMDYLPTILCGSSYIQMTATNVLDVKGFANPAKDELILGISFRLLGI